MIFKEKLKLHLEGITFHATVEILDGYPMLVYFYFTFQFVQISFALSKWRHFELDFELYTHTVKRNFFSLTVKLRSTLRTRAR